MQWNFDLEAKLITGEAVQVSEREGRLTWSQVVIKGLSYYPPSRQDPGLEDKLKRGDLIKKLHARGWVDLDDREQTTIKEAVAALFLDPQVAWGVNDILKTKGRPPE